MNDSLFAAGQPVTYQRYTNNEFVPARVLGPSTRGEQYIHIVYERNGHEQEHHAPLERVSFPIRSPSPSDGAPSPPLSPERGRSPTRSTTRAAHSGPAPAAPLPMGWDSPPLTVSRGYETNAHQASQALVPGHQLFVRRQTGCLVERIPQAASYYNAPCDLLPLRHG